MFRRVLGGCAALGVCLLIALGSDERAAGAGDWYRVPRSGIAAPDVVDLPEGGSARVPVRLEKAPASGQTVAVGVDGLAAEPTELRFTPEDWNEPQYVTLRAPRDEDTRDGSAALRLERAGHPHATVHVAIADAQPSTFKGWEFLVKAPSGYEVKDHPVTAVVPLPYGRFQSTARFRILDADGVAVPAQFEVLNRWWARDKSLRHVAAHFEASVAKNGAARFRFSAQGGTAPAGAHQVTVERADETIVVDTGRLRFTVRTDRFNLLDEVVLDGRTIVASGSNEGAVFTGRLPGDVQRAADRTDLDVRIEEEGPRRAVIRVESLGRFDGKESHRHGFCVRLYAYAGHPYVKVDYQLQNSAINTAKSWPLYFEDVSLHLKPALKDPTLRLAARFGEVWTGKTDGGKYMMQHTHTEAAVHDAADDAVLLKSSVRGGESSFAWADLSDDAGGMAVIVRHFAEMWPNAIEAAPDGSLLVRLWPRQGRQWFQKKFTETGLYWLEDMQHVVKETLLYFHGPGVTDAELEAASANFGYFPVASLPVEAYRETGATFDLDGTVPKRVRSAKAGAGAAPSYKRRELDVKSGKYAFGWMNFGGNTSRRAASRGGGYPKSAAAFVASGHPQHYFEAERRMWGDLNCRPMWLAGYRHDQDFLTVRPSVNPYGGKTWRIFEGHGTDYMVDDWLPGTGWTNKWYPRDNEHGWFYHLEEYYYLSGNYWARDWYAFMAEFRKRTLLRRPGTSKYSKDPSHLGEWNFATRGEGHLLANGWQAYRVTGDPQLLWGLKNRLDWLRAEKWQARWGNLKGKKGGEAAFQIGFAARAVLNYLAELEGHHPEHEQKAFTLLWGLMDWHMNWSQFSYYRKAYLGEGPEPSSGTALTMIDPSILWYVHSGQKDHLDLTLEYASKGLRGGKSPYGKWKGWSGDWPGRAYWAHQYEPKTFGPKPATIEDLEAKPAADGRVRLEWTAPAHAARYLVLWSDRPIARAYTDDESKCNVWYASTVPQTLAARPGERESIEFAAPAAARLYACVVAFASDHHMSDPSNVPCLTRD